MALRIKQPLPAGVEAVIRAVQAGATQLGLEPLLVGATARDLLLVHVFGQRVRRATLDVDFAVALASWQQFEALKQVLIRGHGFQDEPRQKQRLIYGVEGEGKGMTIDLVPFGGLQVDGNTVAWPPEMDVLMTVTGYTEEQQAAVSVELEPGHEVKVASLPGLAILKLFAWSDRGNRTLGKDAIDLLTLLRSYAEAGTFDRFTDPDQALEKYLALECNDERTGAWMLGRDCALLAEGETSAELGALLGDETTRERLLSDMIRGEGGIRGALDRARDLLTLFCEGLVESPDEGQAQA
ncbi:MAG: nucleotidyl transferase AbiEii/AbiGii toxin family protein [Cyanobacteria bacterium]|nr:nucleotidyl transferase AbiEii/AbiGii toxin family protein [Cyanobacteria bacterium bin.51]